MKPWCWAALAGGLLLGPAWAEDEKESAQATRATRVHALQKQVDDAKAAFDKALAAYKEGDPEDRLEKLWQAYKDRADTNIPQALALVRKDPKSALAFETLQWIAVVPRNLFQPYGRRAVALLRAYHAQNPKVAPACSVVGYYGPWDDRPMMEFLRAVAERNPDRTARGQALLGLARLLRNQGRSLEYQKKGDPQPLYREAEQLFATVASKYADCPDLRPVGIAGSGGKLGSEAAAELHELRDLAIGKPAPDIVGEDLDGKPFKLSDYRGKVVVLDFWGHW